MQGARLQAIPQRMRSDAPLVVIPAGVANAVAILQEQRIKNVLRGLVIPLMRQQAGVSTSASNRGCNSSFP